MLINIIATSTTAGAVQSARSSIWCLPSECTSELNQLTLAPASHGGQANSASREEKKGPGTLQVH